MGQCLVDAHRTAAFLRSPQPTTESRAPGGRLRCSLRSPPQPNAGTTVACALSALANHCDASRALPVAVWSIVRSRKTKRKRPEEKERSTEKKLSFVRSLVGQSRQRERRKRWWMGWRNQKRDDSEHDKHPASPAALRRDGWRCELPSLPLLPLRTASIAAGRLLRRIAARARMASYPCCA